MTADPTPLKETSAMSRGDLSPGLLTRSLLAIESDTVVRVGERHIHAENLLLMTGRVLRAQARRIEELEAVVAAYALPQPPEER